MVALPEKDLDCTTATQERLFTIPTSLIRAGVSFAIGGDLLSTVGV